MIDMGMHKGEHVFYVGNRSFAELMEAGEIMAIPDAMQGIIYKRTERCSELEKAAALTLEEAREFTQKWNARIEEQS